jgi:hypothetical protein
VLLRANTCEAEARRSRPDQASLSQHWQQSEPLSPKHHHHHHKIFPLKQVSVIILKKNFKIIKWHTYRIIIQEN